MNLKILQPFQVFSDSGDVLGIVVQTRDGLFGLLPHRLDCVAALTPGIFVYETAAGGEVSSRPQAPCRVCTARQQSA